VIERRFAIWELLERLVQVRDGVIWHRHDFSRRRLTVQVGGRHRNDTCTISRLRDVGAGAWPVLDDELLVKPLR
jgi:hypothetical protein